MFDCTFWPPYTEILEILEFSCSTVALSYCEQYGAVIVDTATKCYKLLSHASIVGLLFEGLYCRFFVFSNNSVNGIVGNSGIIGNWSCNYRITNL